MVTNDATILKLKQEVLYAVSKAAWEDNLKEKEHDIPYDIIPGPQAQYRCCIYKEREIIRQRVRLAEGNVPRARIPQTWCRLSMRHVRNVPSPLTW